MSSTESLLCLTSKNWSSRFSLRRSVGFQFRFEKWLLSAFSGVHACFRDSPHARKHTEDKAKQIGLSDFALLASFLSYGPPNGRIGCRHKRAAPKNFEYIFCSVVKAVKLYAGADKVARKVPVVLEWDHHNQHDRNAVYVFAMCRGHRKMAGHLAKEDAAKLGPFLRNGKLTAEG